MDMVYAAVAMCAEPPACPHARTPAPAVHTNPAHKQRRTQAAAAHAAPRGRPCARLADRARRACPLWGARYAMAAAAGR
eukprot:29633-Chlamydomonas_euryale.AAC.2